MTDSSSKLRFARVGMWILGISLLQLWMGCAKVGEENAVPPQAETQAEIVAEIPKSAMEQPLDDPVNSHEEYGRDETLIAPSEEPATLEPQLALNLATEEPTKEERQSEIELVGQEREEGPRGKPSPLKHAIYHEEIESPEPDADHIATDTNQTVSVPRVQTASYLNDWQDPEFVLFVTGRQYGYMEPCGCTGLANAKGGLSRRHTLMKELQARGWPVVAVDVGNQVRRFGKQADIKFQRTVDVLSLMGYEAVCFGPDDLRLSIDGIMQPVSALDKFVCCNADLLGLNHRFRIVEVNGKKIGITGVIGPTAKKAINAGDELVLSKVGRSVKQALDDMQAENPDYLVLLSHMTLSETREIIRRLPNAFDVVVTAGGAGEPTLEPEEMEGSKSKIIQVGTKGMYVGAVGFFAGGDAPIRYGRLTLDKEFGDSQEVLDIFADYQKLLEIQGLDGLGAKPQPHPRGTQFVGHEKCGECHTEAYEVFENSPHFHATQSLVDPNERSEIARHFDPECLSCHVTGWNAQQYFPYKTGYWSLSEAKLHTNGCENCHGPGSDHVAVEEGNVDVTDAVRERLRAAMRMTMKQAQSETGCISCHDIDNSPEFDFDTYWPQIEHKGVD